MPKVKIKRLHEDAVLPKYATSGASGFDLVSIEDLAFRPGTTRLVRTGLAMEIEEGYELQIRPRSGMSLETPLRVANAPGTVDSDYRGEICVIVTNSGQYHHTGNSTEYTIHTIMKGQRIAQGVIQKVERADFEEVHGLSETERGEGGFGSTGK